MGGKEMAFIQKAFRCNYIAPLGPQVDAFEREFAEYTGIPHCLAVSSGTAAMHLALRVLDVGPRDDVMASTLTFIGGVSPAVFQGANLTFVDSERASWNIDPDLLDEALKVSKKRGKLPKAVIPTDLFGQCCDYERILAICDSYGVPVVMDAAEAVGARYKRAEGTGAQARRASWAHAGAGAEMSVFSFNGNKIITTGGGGMLASQDKSLIAQARKLSQQAREARPYYEHKEIGYNYRMSNILAAIGLGQLRALDKRIKRKREIFEHYEKFLKGIEGIEFMPQAPYSRCTRWLTVILIDAGTFGADREAVRLALEAKNIEARPVWKPMHLQPVFQGRTKVVGGKVAEDIFLRGLCLPSGTNLSRKDLDRVIKIIAGCRKKRPVKSSGTKRP